MSDNKIKLSTDEPVTKAFFGVLSAIKDLQQEEKERVVSSVAVFIGMVGYK